MLAVVCMANVWAVGRKFSARHVLCPGEDRRDLGTLCLPKPLLSGCASSPLFSSPWLFVPAAAGIGRLPPRALCLGVASRAGSAVLALAPVTALPTLPSTPALLGPARVSPRACCLPSCPPALSSLCLPALAAPRIKPYTMLLPGCVCVVAGVYSVLSYV